MGDLAEIDGVEPAVPEPGLAGEALGMDEAVLGEVGSAGQTVGAHVFARRHRHEMQVAKRPAMHLRRHGRAEADHDVGLVFPQVVDVGEIAHRHLDARMLAREPVEVGGHEGDVEAVGDR